MTMGGRLTDKTALKETFERANLPAEIEVYTGTAHGWRPPDSQVYTEPQSGEGMGSIAGTAWEGFGVRVVGVRIGGEDRRAYSQLRDDPRLVRRW